jgi:type IV pilus assembly protein PilB
VVQNDLSPFGNKLVQGGYVNNAQMQQALVQSRKTGTPLTQIVEALTGQALPPDLIRQYKRQQLFELKVLYGVESLDPELDEKPSDEIAELIGTLIPIDICRRHRLIPLAKQDTDPPSVLVAMVDPDNLTAQDELNRILRPQQLTSQRLVIAIEAEDFEGADLSTALKEASGAPVVTLANKILVKAVTTGTSDIHIEPQEKFLRIRFRRDGVLQQAFPPFPKKIIPAIISRFKIMADLDIAERRQPQDGRIRRVFRKKTIDFRVNTLPSRFGEKIVMRILNSAATKLGLDKLVTDPETLAIMRDMSSRPYGLILVVGPTGSGKSTSLYSMLAERNSPTVNISTAEDPIEYTLPGLTQVQVIREKGMDFASILRAFMRQDPDIILVGETRDLETAKTAIEAALTGHLVLTTLHATMPPVLFLALMKWGLSRLWYLPL